MPRKKIPRPTLPSLSPTAPKSDLPETVPPTIRDRTAERLGLISGAQLVTMELTPEEEEQARREDMGLLLTNPVPSQGPLAPIKPVTAGVVKKERTEPLAYVKQQAWLASQERKGVEPMATSKTAELQQALGAEYFKGAREAGKEAAKGPANIGLAPDGAFIAPEIVDSLQQLVREYQTVGVQIRRKNQLTQTFASLRAIPEVAPSLLVSPGIDELVRDWSGGGEYEINIVAPGLKPIKLYRTIEGDPLPAKPDRNTQQAAAGALPGALPGGVNPGAIPTQAFVPPTSGMPAGITWQQVPGQPWNWKAMPTAPTTTDPMMVMLAMLMEQRAPRGGETDERLREMERRMTEEKRELERRLEEEKRERAEEARRREDERAREQQNSRIEQLALLIQQQHQQASAATAAAAADEKWKTLAALGPMIAPVITTMLTRGDSQMAMFGKVLETQQGSSQQNIDVLKTLLERPGPEDRMAKMVGTFSDLMAAQLSSMSGLIQSGLLDKGGDSPAVQIVSQILSTVGEVGKVMLAAKMGMSMDDEEEDEIRALPAPAAPAPPLVQPVPVQAAPVDGQVAGLEEELVPEAEDVPEEAEDEEGMQVDLANDPAFAKIIELVMNEGDVKEIAVRMWRHAGSGEEKNGHPLAVAWMKYPVEAGQRILTQLVGITNERILEVTNAIVALNAYIRNGGDPEQYATGLKPKKAKKAKLVPVADAAPPELVAVPTVPPAQNVSSEMTSTTSE